MIYILGNGLLASELRHLCTNGRAWRMLTRRDVDITDETAVRRIALSLWRSDDLIINTAAYTNVDGAESEPGLSFAVNAHGARNVARCAAACGVRLVHLSSDAVFNQEGAAPTELDMPTELPLSVYAQSKLLGERWVSAEHPSATIVRTGNLYGECGKGWPSRISVALREGALREDPTADSYREIAPTWARWVAEMCLAALPPGPVHACAAGQTTWRQYVTRFVKIKGTTRDVRGHQFERRARLPRRGTLDSIVLSTLGVTQPSWESLMDRFVKEEKTCSAS